MSECAGVFAAASFSDCGPVHRLDGETAANFNDEDIWGSYVLYWRRSRGRLHLSQSSDCRVLYGAGARCTAGGRT